MKRNYIYQVSSDPFHTAREIVAIIFRCHMNMLFAILSHSRRTFLASFCYNLESLRKGILKIFNRGNIQQVCPFVSFFGAIQFLSFLSYISCGVLLAFSVALEHYGKTKIIIRKIIRRRWLVTEHQFLLTVRPFLFSCPRRTTLP